MFEAQNDSAGTDSPPAELRQHSVYVHTHLFLCVCVRLQTARSKWCSTVGRLAHLCFWFWLSIHPLHFLVAHKKLMVVYPPLVSALRCASYRQMQTARREVFFSLFSTSVIYNLLCVCLCRCVRTDFPLCSDLPVTFIASLCDTFTDRDSAVD